MLIVVLLLLRKPPVSELAAYANLNRTLFTRHRHLSLERKDVLIVVLLLLRKPPVSEIARKTAYTSLNRTLAVT